MIKPSWAKILLTIGRIILAAIFLVAGYSKIKPLPGLPWSVASLRTSLVHFEMEVDAYQMLPLGGVQVVGQFLPFFELLLGVWILSGIGLRFSSLISIGAFGAFMVAIAWAYYHHLTIKCGCGIGPDEQVGPVALARDGIAFLPLALAVAFGAFRMHRKLTSAECCPVTPAPPAKP